MFEKRPEYKEKSSKFKKLNNTNYNKLGIDDIRKIFEETNKPIELVASPGLDRFDPYPSGGQRKKRSRKSRKVKRSRKVKKSRKLKK